MVLVAFPGVNVEHNSYCYMTVFIPIFHRCPLSYLLSTVDVGEVTGSRTGVKAVGTNTDAQSAIPQSVKEAVTTAYDDKAAECDSKRTDTSA